MKREELAPILHDAYRRATDQWLLSMADAALEAGSEMTTRPKPQTCVWRPFLHDKKNWLDIGCRYSWIESNCIGGPAPWRFCPWCGKPIEVKKARTR